MTVNYLVKPSGKGQEKFAFPEKMAWKNFTQKI
jgi:hypothetical protein